MTRSVYLGPLLAPTVFAFLTHADTHLRLLVLTSGGARLLTGLLLVVALGVAYLLRPTAGVSTDFRREVVDRVGRARYWLIGTSLLGIGNLQAGSYRVVAMDDLARYWIIAEDIMGGRGYPAWAGGGASAGEWVWSPRRATRPTIRAAMARAAVRPVVMRCAVGQRSFLAAGSGR